MHFREAHVTQDTKEQISSPARLCTLNMSCLSSCPRGFSLSNQLPQIFLTFLVVVLRYGLVFFKRLF